LKHDLISFNVSPEEWQSVPVKCHKWRTAFSYVMNKSSQKFQLITPNDVALIVTVGGTGNGNNDDERLYC